LDRWLLVIWEGKLQMSAEVAVEDTRLMVVKQLGFRGRMEETSRYLVESSMVVMHPLQV
jgi:hypothetical protein